MGRDGLSLLAGFGIVLALAAVARAGQGPQLVVPVTDPSQLEAEDRLGRVNNVLKIMESGPKDPHAKRIVGVLLMFRKDLGGELARRAAKALKAVTGQDHGTDFDAWNAWFETVREKKEWKPVTIYRTNPAYVAPKGPRLVVYAATIKEGEGGWKELSAPCGLACAERGFFVRSPAPLKVRVLDRPVMEPVMELEGEQVVLVAGAGEQAPLAIVTAAKLMLMDLEPDFIDREKLRRVPQQADDKQLAAKDPGAVLRYAFEEARSGNFLPHVRLYLRPGGQWQQELGKPGFRQKAAERFRLDADSLKGLEPEALVTELLRADYPRFLLTTSVEVDEPRGDRVDARVRRVGATTGMRLLRTTDGWRFE